MPYPVGLPAGPKKTLEVPAWGSSHGHEKASVSAPPVGADSEAALPPVLDTVTRTTPAAAASSLGPESGAFQVVARKASSKTSLIPRTTQLAGPLPQDAQSGPEAFLERVASAVNGSNGEADPKSIGRGLYFAGPLEGLAAEKPKQEVAQTELSTVLYPAAVPAEGKKSPEAPPWVSLHGNERASVSASAAGTDKEDALPLIHDSVARTTAPAARALSLESGTSRVVERMATPWTLLLPKTTQLAGHLPQSALAVPEAFLERVASAANGKNAEKVPQESPTEASSSKGGTPRRASAAATRGVEPSPQHEASIRNGNEPMEAGVSKVEAAAVAMVTSPIVATEPSTLATPDSDPAITDLDELPCKTDRSSVGEPPASNSQMMVAFRARLVAVSPPPEAMEARARDGGSEQSKFAGTKHTEDTPRAISRPKVSAEPAAQQPEPAQSARGADPATPLASSRAEGLPAEKDEAPRSQNASAEHVDALLSRESTAGEPASASTPPLAAHAIQVQLDRGEQRVNVLLAQRGGEVHVSVRTPDPQLAGALRQQLPVLSSRLEQTGFQTETWHPAQWHAPDRRAPAAEMNLASPPRGNHGETPQGGQQRHPEPRPSKPNGAQSGTVTPRKEFQWLMSQLP